MSNIEIAKQLVQMCKEGRNMEAVEQLYGQNIVSIEASAPPAGGEREMSGIEAVKGKGQWWVENHEIHEAKVEGPWPHGDNKFAVRFAYDVTNKPMSMRMKMDEIGIYTIENDKIVREEFFYTMGQ